MIGHAPQRIVAPDEPDKLADEMVKLFPVYFALNNLWGPHLLAANRKVEAKFGPAPRGDQKGANALRNKLLRPHRAVERRMNAACDRLRKLVDLIAARKKNSERALALVMIYEWRPGMYDHLGELHFPDDEDDGATRNLFYAVAERAGLTPLVRSIEKGLAANARLIAKQKRAAKSGAKMKPARNAAPVFPFADRVLFGAYQKFAAAYAKMKAADTRQAKAGSGQKPTALQKRAFAKWERLVTVAISAAADFVVWPAVTIKGMLLKIQVLGFLEGIPNCDPTLGAPEWKPFKSDDAVLTVAALRCDLQRYKNSGAP